MPRKIKIADFTTPVGIAVYPHLISPDTKWKEEGEYRTRLKYDADTAAKVRETLSKFLDEAFDKYKDALIENGKKAKIKTVSKAELPIRPEVDDDGDETGAYLLNTKRVASGIRKKDGKPWRAKIVIADAFGKTVKTKDLSIWSGSELRVKGEVMGWYNAKDNEIGITVEIAGVQIKKLVSGGERDVNFDAIDDDGDGWTASEDADESQDNDSSDDDSDDTPDF